VAEIANEIACDFDPTKPCPIKEGISKRGQGNWLIRLEDRVTVKLGPDMLKLQAGGVPPVMGIEPDTCKEGPREKRRIIRMGQTCTANIVFGTFEEYLEQIDRK
jgi:hypothetical protein